MCKRRLSALLSVVAGMLLAVLAAAQPASPPPSAVSAADLVYRSGVILTMHDATPRAEAVAVKDGKIVAVGARPDVEKLAGPQTQTVNLQGRTLLPGFVDSHGHLFGIGLQAASANLLPTPDGEGNDIASLRRLLTTWDTAGQSPLKKAGLIFGFGCDESQLKDQWSGTLILVGQQAEEPITGAAAMVEDGLYSKHGVPVPDYLLGLHAAPGPTGMVASSGGGRMAGTDQKAANGL